MRIIPRGYVCYRAEAPLDIDGRLDKSVWQAAPWTEDFVDIEGDLRPRPPLRTRAKMLWDDEYLYIGAELEEPHVWATLTEHDSVIYQDPDFEVFIDPDGDNHQYYEIEINALNTEWDLRLPKPYRDGGPAIDEWEIPGFRSAVHVDGTINDPEDTDVGWSVEMAIPWVVLGEFAKCPCPPRPGDQWRVDFSRVEWHVEILDGRYEKRKGIPEENWVWSPQGVIDMHRPETWGYVQFSTAAPGSDAFCRDPAEPIRMYLMDVYHAQRAFREANGRWAGDMSDLAVPVCEGVTQPEMRLSEQGYIASATFEATSERWNVREDSLLWKEAV
ncbi:MAG TPA: carbohydrate-binding family 9-like protein [Armatimonadota bacterium]|jgi:hypothetical protein